MINFVELNKLIKYHVSNEISILPRIYLIFVGRYNFDIVANRNF